MRTERERERGREIFTLVYSIFRCNQKSSFFFLLCFSFTFLLHCRLAIKKTTTHSSRFLSFTLILIVIQTEKTMNHLHASDKMRRKSLHFSNRISRSIQWKYTCVFSRNIFVKFILIFANNNSKTCMCFA